MYNTIKIERAGEDQSHACITYYFHTFGPGIVNSLQNVPNIYVPWRQKQCAVSAGKGHQQCFSTKVFSSNDNK